MFVVACLLLRLSAGNDDVVDCADWSTVNGIAGSVGKASIGPLLEYFLFAVFPDGRAVSGMSRPLRLYCVECTIVGTSGTSCSLSGRAPNQLRRFP